MAELQESKLTDEEFNEFNRIVSTATGALLMFADGHNINRDSLMKYYANVISAVCEISTFEHYGKEKNNG